MLHPENQTMKETQQSLADQLAIEEAELSRMRSEWEANRSVWLSRIASDPHARVFDTEQLQMEISEKRSLVEQLRDQLAHEEKVNRHNATAATAPETIRSAAQSVRAMSGNLALINERLAILEAKISATEAEIHQLDAEATGKEQAAGIALAEAITGGDAKAVKSAEDKMATASAQAQKAIDKARTQRAVIEALTVKRAELVAEREQTMEQIETAKQTAYGSLVDKLKPEYDALAEELAKLAARMQAAASRAKRGQQFFRDDVRIPLFEPGKWRIDADNIDALAADFGDVDLIPELADSVSA